MSTILAMRLLARVITNSPLAGIEYCYLTLSGGEPIQLRAVDFRVEKVAGKPGEEYYDADHYVQFDKRFLDEAGVAAVMPGDLFTDRDGTAWQMVHPLDNGNGMIRARLIKPQKADPMGYGTGPRT